MKPAKRFFYILTVPLLGTLLGIFIYGYAFKAPFQFDDLTVIADNVLIKDLRNIPLLWKSDPSRFLAYCSFSLNYHWHKLDVAGYHAVNFIIHLLATVCVFFLLRMILRRSLGEKYPLLRLEAISVLASFIFLCHPLQTGAVTYISQRSTLLAGLFYLLTLVFYIRYREQNKRIFYRWAVVSAAFGLLTKPIIITLPFSMLLCEIFFFDLLKSRSKKVIRGLAPFFLAVIIVPLLLVLWKYQSFRPDYLLAVTRETPEISRKDYLLTQFNVCTTYLRLLIWPVNQNLDYDYPITRAFFSFPTYLSFGILLAFFLAALKLFNKNRALSFAVFWFFLLLSVESGIFPISDVIFEHRLYLPMAAFVLAFSISLGEFIADVRLYIVVMLAVICAFSTATLRRNRIWGNGNLSILLDTVQKSPRKVRPHNNLGFAYQKGNDWGRAQSEYQKAIALAPGDPYPHNNLGSLYVLQAKNSQAIGEFKKAISLRADYAAPYYNLGNIYKNRGDLKKAEEYYLKALEKRPNFAQAHVGLGNVYFLGGNFSSAKHYLLEAVRLSPDAANPYCILGDLYLGEGKYQIAFDYYQKSAQRDPRMVSAYNNMGNIYDINGQYVSAVDAYQKAVMISPRFANAYFNLGRTLAKLGRGKEAQRALRYALEIYRNDNDTVMAARSQQQLDNLVQEKK